MKQEFYSVVPCFFLTYALTRHVVLKRYAAAGGDSESGYSSNTLNTTVSRTRSHHALLQVRTKSGFPALYVESQY